MSLKLFDSELKVMELIWENEPISAKEISLLANEKFDWNKNTTYTVIKKLIEKGYVNREDPNFVCTSVITKDDVCKAETQSLIDRLFNGSKKAFFSAFLNNEELSKKDIEDLRKEIDKR